jgi:hypothetical protein
MSPGYQHHGHEGVKRRRLHKRGLGRNIRDLKKQAKKTCTGKGMTDIVWRRNGKRAKARDMGIMSKAWPMRASIGISSVKALRI